MRPPTLFKPESNHVRQVASDRRRAAFMYFAQSGIVCAVPLFAYLLFHVVWPLWIIVLFLIAGRIYYLQANNQWRSAKRADQGAEGEDQIAEILAALPKTWTVERSLRFKGIGDIDFFVQSPQKQNFVIEVKSHYGHVSWNEKELVRLKNGCGIPFEKDFISQAMDQALRIREERSLPFVTPVLVFTQAKVHLHERKVRNVVVLQKDELLTYLTTAS